jgi:outer membrane biosynthesis protein TonB
MRGPSLQKTTLLSFALHLTVFMIAFLILRQSSHIVLPPPYTVDLVSPDVLTGSDKGTTTEAGPVSPETKESREPAAPAEISRKSKKQTAKDKELIAKRINDLRQSERIKKKIEAIKEKKI